MLSEYTLADIAVCMYVNNLMDIDESISIHGSASKHPVDIGERISFRIKNLIAKHLGSSYLYQPRYLRILTCRTPISVTHMDIRGIERILRDIYNQIVFAGSRDALDFIEAQNKFTPLEIFKHKRE